MRLSSFVSRCVVSRIAAVVCLGAALLLPAAASAQTCTVTSTADTTTAGTLRYCANNVAQYTTIDLSTLPPLSVITLVQSLDINGVAPVTLHGPANGGVTISGENSTQAIIFAGVPSAAVDHLVFQNVILEPVATALTMTNVTVFGITSSNNPAVDASSLILKDSTITGNAGGGVGAIGTVNITQSTIYGNASYDVAASVQTTISQSIVGTTIGPAPTETQSYVGTSAQLGPLQLNGSLFPTMLPLVGSPVIGIAGTTTADERGFPGKSTGDAGAVQTNYITVMSLGDAAAGTCTASSCTLHQAINTANSNMGGDITFGSLASAAAPGTITLTSALPNITSLVDIAGPGANALSVSGAGMYVITTIMPGGSLAFNGVTAAASNGQYAGAFVNSGLLTLAHSAVTGTTNGSGISNGISGATNETAAVVSNSTIAGNNSPYPGGGIVSAAALSLLDSTLSGNTATSGFSGGGLYQNGGTLLVAGSTISANVAGNGEGGGISVQATTATIANSVVEGNSTSGGTYPGTYPDIEGSYMDGGGNLINTSATATSNPQLGPLAYNGGTTQTMLPLPGSSAICTGSAVNGQAYGTTTDERSATHSTAYCRTTELDAGAVQTSYSALTFVQQPENTDFGSTLNPAPTLALTEDGIGAGNVPLMVTGAGADGLTGTTTETTASGGVATFGNLKFSIGNGLDVPATLHSSAVITPSGYSGTQFTLSSTSNDFEITGPPYGSTSSLALSPSTIAVGDNSTANVTARDQVGYPISGVAVTVTNSNSSVATAPSQVVTGANGMATFVVSGAGPGSAVITANFTGGVGHTSATIMVTGPPSSATSTLIATPSMVDVASMSTVTATVEDAAGNPIPNAAVSVTFTSASAPVTVTQGSMTNQFAAGQAGSFSGTTNASGQVVYNLTAGAPTHVTVNGTTGNITFTQAPVLTFAQPSYIVTLSTDDATGVPANCADQAANPTGTNTNCSLRDAIAAANAEGAGAVANITFSQKLLASPFMITLGSGGTLNITNGMTIQGLSGTPGQVSVSGANAYEVFDVNPGTGAGAVTFNSLTITQGKNVSKGSGGGVEVDGGTVTVTGSTISGNSGSSGGGMVISGGTVTVTGSAISNNNSPNGGSGGIIISANSSLAVIDSTISGNSSGGNSFGGGIAVGVGTVGPVTITGSTLSGNSATAGSALFIGSTVTLANSTLSRNSAGESGAIYEYVTGNLIVTGSTISGNTAVSNTTGIVAQGGGGTQTINNTLITDTVSGFVVPTNQGNVTTGANLSALGNYGGPTQTILPLPGSAAICGGLVSVANGAPANNQAYTDQRGAAHSAAYCSAGQLDAGAVQTSYSLGNGFTTNPPSTVSPGMPITPAPAVTVTENALAASGDAVALSAANGTLSGTTMVSSGANSVATFGGVSITGSSPEDALTATLNLGPTAGAPQVTVTSTAFSATSLMPGTLPNGTVGVAYSQTLSVSGGSGAYAYSISGGALPAGLMLGMSTGTISGTPSAGGSFPFSVSASNSGGTTTQSYTLTINGATIAVMPPTLPAFTVGMAVSVNFTASGGTAPYTFSVSGGALPQGLTLNATNGLLSGAPMQAGPYAFTVNATDASTGTGPYPGSHLYNGNAGMAAAGVTVAAVSQTYGTASATLSATVTYAAGVRPAGIFTFTVGSGTAVPATCTQNANSTTTETCTASYGTATLAAGQYAITGRLAADINYATASGTNTLTITAVTPTITFTVPNHSYGDAPFPVSATSNATGAFTYMVVSGNATISGNVVSLTGIGTVVLQASEAADLNDTAGSQQTSFSVAPAPLTVSANYTMRYYGAANPAFTGTVAGQRYNDTFTESFMTNPVAKPTSAPGAYSIVPAAAGADLGDYTVTTTNGTLTITQAPTAATLTASTTTLNPNQTVTLMATIASTTSGMPTGSVTFSDNGMALGTAPLMNGTASYPVTLPPTSTNSLTVRYSGDVNFLPSSSGNTLTVSVAPLSFTFTDTGATALTEAPGNVATYTFQLSPDFGSYASAVTFSVTGLPPGATATFTPTSVAAGSGTQTVVMSVQTAKAFAREQIPVRPFVPRQLPLLALLLLPLLGSREMRRRLGSRLLMLMLLAGGLASVAGMSGCGFSNGFLLEQPATYTLTVTATAGPLQQSQTVTLEVQ